jgi:hypothetical protein
MKIGLSIIVAFGILLSFAGGAAASCEQSDYICEKFARMQAKKAAARQRTRARRTRKTSRQQTVATATIRQPGSANPAPAQNLRAKTSMVSNIISSPPAIKVDKLKPGAIATPPQNLMSLVFGSSDMIEVATAKCQPTEPRATRSITCAVAVHRAKLNSSPGAGCASSLGLQQLEFNKKDDGSWVNEDSISLCGGRLLRRTELFPVSLNGTPKYALREEYQMLGGDGQCAVPYLQGRMPLKKSYLPSRHGPASRLRCGTVAAR